jgi:hypothetical protein
VRVRRRALTQHAAPDKSPTSKLALPTPAEEQARRRQRRGACGVRPRLTDPRARRQRLYAVENVTLNQSALPRIGSLGDLRQAISAAAPVERSKAALLLGAADRLAAEAIAAAAEPK